MKKAFSLVELIVVIGIIAILIGMLVALVPGGIESARDAKCLTNMKNLATACNTCAMATGWYPLAGSMEVKQGDNNAATGSLGWRYSEWKGWVSWNSRNAYSGGGTSSHTSAGGWFTSAYNKDADVRLHALTNGAIWKYVSENSDVFVCPLHRKRMRKENPLWSYVMNQKFGYDTSQGSKANIAPTRREYGHLGRADRMLLFAELQFLPNDIVQVSADASAGFKNDCTLQYDKDEIIGFNHANGKRGLFAHLAFADGHVEKLSIPATPKGKGWAVKLGQNDLKDLTKWLCEGKDVTFNGKRYEVTEN